MPEQRKPIDVIPIRRPMSVWVAGSVQECLDDAATGLVDAIVTNPTVVADWCADGQALPALAREVTSRTGLPLFLQTRSTEPEALLDEALALCELAPGVVPKLPATFAGLSVTRRLVERGVRPLITMVCTVRQALTFASNGAGSLCPYYARLHDAGGNPVALIRTAADAIRRAGIDCPILPASIRKPEQVDDAMSAGAAGVIVFHSTFRAMLNHPVTDGSLEAFEREDWPRIRG